MNTYICSSSEINRSKSDTRRNSTWSPSTLKLPLGRTGWRTYLSWVWRGLGSGSRVCHAGAPLIPTPPCSMLCLTQGPKLSIYWLTEGQTRWAGHTVLLIIYWVYWYFVMIKKKLMVAWYVHFEISMWMKVQDIFKNSKILDCTISDQKKIQYF